MLLCLWSPLPDLSLVGQEHGRTIPLCDIRLPISLRGRPALPRNTPRGGACIDRSYDIDTE